MDECIFCKIIAGEIPSDKVYEDARSAEKAHTEYAAN